MQTELTSEVLQIGFHFFILGFLVAWFFLRLWIRDLKKEIKSLSRELQKEYEYNAFSLAGKDDR
jgi:uncharacterized membrane protein (DUF485 family)